MAKEKFLVSVNHEGKCQKKVLCFLIEEASDGIGI